jgi:hypothetical protein
MDYDKKGLQIGLFVLSYDVTPALNRLQVEDSGSKGPIIGKKVMCRDLKPALGRFEVMDQDLKPASGRSKVTNQHFGPVSGRSEKTGDDFRGDMSNDGLAAWHFRCVPSAGQGLCLAETTNAETACAVSKQLIV